MHELRTCATCCIARESVCSHSATQALARVNLDSDIQSLQHAGDIEAAIESCQQALQYDADNAAVTALLAELTADSDAAGATYAGTKERAGHRFKAGHYGAAASAYAALAAWGGGSAGGAVAGPQKVTAVERAAAASNEALCRMKLGQHVASIAACQRALVLLLSDCRGPASHAGAASSSKHGTSAGGESAASESGSAAKLTPQLDIQSADDAYELAGRLQGHCAVTREVAALKLAMKVFARAASCCAHLRRYTIASVQYEVASELATAAGDVDAAATLYEDAAHMLRLDCKAVLMDIQSESDSGQAPPGEAAASDGRSELRSNGNVQDGPVASGCFGRSGLRCTE